MTKYGFTLIESLVYLFLASLCMLMLAQVTSNVSARARERQQATRRLLNGAVCLQHCIAQLKRAPFDGHAWYRCDDHALVYQLPDHAVGWFFESDRLVKCTGRWTDAKFQKTSSSLLLEDISSGHFKVVRGKGINQDMIRSVEIDMTYHAKQYVVRVALLLGVIS